MEKIKIPLNYNYLSAFLTFSCNLRCNYCINRYNGLYKYKPMPAKDWIRGLNRIEARKDLPITITGGEPTIHRGFYKILTGMNKNIPVDLLTNGKFKLLKFLCEIPPDRIKRKAKYASIRFSYHPGYTNPIELLYTVHKLLVRNYSVGIWAVDNKDERIGLMEASAKDAGIDFRTKDFLDSTHGTYKYPKGLDGKRKKCMCKPSELLIAPDGRMFRCHYDLYYGINSYGHILASKVKLPTGFLPCNNYGLCSPCDLKEKNNRYQEFGWCSVTIKPIDKV